MFSSNVKTLSERHEVVAICLEEESVPVASLREDRALPFEPRASLYSTENPYAPPNIELEERSRPGLFESGEERVSSYVRELIETSHGVSTTKYVAGCVVCESAAAILLSTVRGHIFANPFSATDAPQFVLLGGLLGFAAMYCGLECGVVLAHRGWRRFRLRADGD